MNRSGVLLAFALAIAAIIASPVGPDGIAKCYREECQPGQNPEQCKQCCEQLIQRFFKDVDAIRTGCIGNCSGSDPTIVPSSMIGFGDWFSWIPFIGPYLAQLFGGAAPISIPTSPFDAILKSLNLPIPGAIAEIGAITGGASGSASGGLSGSAAGGITGGITKAITDAVSPILGILNPPKPNVTAAVISIPSSPFDDILKSLNLPIPGVIAGTGGVSGTATGGATGSISGSAAGGASGNATAGATGSATGGASGSIAGSATGAANATRAATGNATATATGTATGTAAGNATAATSSVTGALGSAVSNLLGGILG